MEPAAQGCDLVVIGASAGGVEALQGLFRNLPKCVSASFLVVLHLGDRQISQLSSIISSVTELSVANAVDGQHLEHGCVYVAIAGHQLTVEPGILRVLESPRVDWYRPSIDALFRSAALTYGPRVAGVVLSGMLSDGTAGLRHIAAGGGVTIVQDPDEAFVRGMPESAIMGNDVQFTLPVVGIAALLGRLAGAREISGTRLPMPRASLPAG